jgi:hypothetical protein
MEKSPAKTPEPDQSNPYPYALFSVHFNILEITLRFSRTSLSCWFCLIIIVRLFIKCEVTFYIFLYLVYNWIILYLLFRCRIWAERAGCAHLLEKGVEVLNTSYRLCSDHFDDKCYTSTERRRLSNCALPAIFTHNSGKIYCICRIQSKAR